MSRRNAGTAAVHRPTAHLGPVPPLTMHLFAPTTTNGKLVPTLAFYSMHHRVGVRSWRRGRDTSVHPRRWRRRSTCSAASTQHWGLRLGSTGSRTRQRCHWFDLSGTAQNHNRNHSHTKQPQPHQTTTPNSQISSDIELTLTHPADSCHVTVRVRRRQRLQRPQLTYRRDTPSSKSSRQR